MRKSAFGAPAAVAKGTTSRDNLSFAVGPRFHIKLSDTAWFRPGIAYARGIDGSIVTSDYNIVQLDLPFVF